MDQLEPPLGNDDVMESWHASPRFKHDFKYAVKTASKVCALKIQRDFNGEDFLQEVLPNMENHFLELCRTCEADCKQASVVKACQFSQMVLKGMFIS